VARTHQPKTHRGVTVIRIVPVAVGRARVGWIVVPGAAAQGTARFRGAPPVARRQAVSGKARRASPACEPSIVVGSPDGAIAKSGCYLSGDLEIYLIRRRPGFHFAALGYDWTDEKKTRRAARAVRPPPAAVFSERESVTSDQQLSARSRWGTHTPTETPPWCSGPPDRPCCGRPRARWPDCRSRSRRARNGRHLPSCPGRPGRRIG
jgi:hypothetical protein